MLGCHGQCGLGDTLDLHTAPELGLYLGGHVAVMAPHPFL